MFLLVVFVQLFARGEFCSTGSAAEGFIIGCHSGLLQFLTWSG